MIPAEAWPTWTGSNHDAARFPTRWCGGDEQKIRAALVMLLTLRGTPILYYGDEIGMTERPCRTTASGIRSAPRVAGRSRSRPGADADALDERVGGGFTRPGVEPWLPEGEAASATWPTSATIPARCCASRGI